MFKKCIFLFRFIQKRVVDDPMATLGRPYLGSVLTICRKKQLINVGAALGACRIYRAILGAPLGSLWSDMQQ